MKNLIYGKNTVIDAIKNNFKIKKLYLLKPLNFKLEQNIRLEIINKKQMDEMILGNHQGFVAEIESFQYHDLNEIIKTKPRNVLVLDHIQDPHNLGAILRNANAFGFNYIIVPDKRSVLINPLVLKISSGGYINLKIIKVKSLLATINKLKKLNYWVYATSFLPYSKKLTEVNFNEQKVIIIGNEQKGVSKTLINISDKTFYINMYGTVQSLNVSVACGIIMFAVHQKK